MGNTISGIFQNDTTSELFQLYMNGAIKWLDVILDNKKNTETYANIIHELNKMDRSEASLSLETYHVLSMRMNELCSVRITDVADFKGFDHDVWCKKVGVTVIPKIEQIFQRIVEYDCKYLDHLSMIHLPTIDPRAPIYDKNKIHYHMLALLRNNSHSTSVIIELYNRYYRHIDKIISDELSKHLITNLSDIVFDYVRIIYAEEQFNDVIDKKLKSIKR